MKIWCWMCWLWHTYLCDGNSEQGCYTTLEEVYGEAKP